MSAPMRWWPASPGPRTASPQRQVSWLLGALCLLAVVVLGGSDALGAEPAGLKELMGTWLGRATVKDTVAQRTEEREIDIEITPFKGDGFRIRWVNVTLVGGRRDVPGVIRRVSEAAFEPDRTGTFFVEAPEASLFAEREELAPIGGDPVRWAVLDAAGLHLHAFFVLPDGRYELQTYSRRRTAEGMALHYQRIVDGERLRTIEGHAVKAQ